MITIKTSNPEVHGASACLEVRSNPHGDIWLCIGAARTISITVSPSDLAAALNGLVPGLSVTYVPPVMVPQGIGAVVQAYRMYWIRVGGVVPEGLWSSENGYWTKTDSEIAKLLSAGAEILSGGVTL